MKQCIDCEKEGLGPKPLSEFNKSARHKDGFAGRCRAHYNARWRRLYRGSDGGYTESRKTWAQKNPTEARLVNVRKKLQHDYGLSQKQYEQMYKDQKGRCAIGGEPVLSQFDPGREFTKRLKVANVAYVDHCHETKVVRGLLCFNCNIALGKFQDDKKLLLKATRYLDESRTAQAQPMADRKTASEIEPVYQSRDLDSSMSRVSRRAELSPFL
jgi:hypothetical protein